MVLSIERRGPVAAAFLNRPTVHNALDTGLRSALVSFWELVRDTDDIRVAIVAGIPGSSFSSGRDMKETASAYAADKAGADWELGTTGTGYPIHTPTGKPIVAAVDRWCLGAGLKVAIECDIRICTPRARFGSPQVKVGRGTESPLYLRKAGVPAAVVNDMVLTGEPLDAEAALRWGVVSRVVPEADLIDEAWRIAGLIAEGSPAVVGGTIRGLRAGLAELPLEVAVPLWRTVTAMFGDTSDARVGAAAFDANRPAAF